MNHHQEVLIKEITLSDIQWVGFINELKSLEVSCWKDKYYDNDICDGTQWELTIKLPNRKKICKCGSNKYPPYWKNFIKLLNKYVGESVG